MTPQEFNNIFQDTIMALEKLVESKGSVYAHDKNRLHNFDRASTLGNDSAIQACFGMWRKQLVSLLDMIDTNEKAIGRPDLPQERFDEVVNDLLVYLILTKALFYRAYGWKPISTPKPDFNLTYACSHTSECICGATGLSKQYPEETFLHIEMK